MQACEAFGRVCEQMRKGIEEEVVGPVKQMIRGKSGGEEKLEKGGVKVLVFSFLLI